MCALRECYVYRNIRKRVEKKLYILNAHTLIISKTERERNIKSHHPGFVPFHIQSVCVYACVFYVIDFIFSSSFVISFSSKVMLIPFNLYQTLSILLPLPPVRSMHRHTHSPSLVHSFLLQPLLLVGITFYHILKVPFNDLCI